MRCTVCYILSSYTVSKIVSYLTKLLASVYLQTMVSIYQCNILTVVVICSNHAPYIRLAIYY